MLRLLEKSKSRVRKANLKESFVHAMSNPATHLVCFVLESKLFSFSLPHRFF